MATTLADLLNAYVVVNGRKVFTDGRVRTLADLVRTDDEMDRLKRESARILERWR